MKKFLKGKFEDKNKYFRCPVCGFVNTVDRNNKQDIMNITIASTTIEGSTVYYPVVNAGCAFCGCVNL